MLLKNLRNKAYFAPEDGTGTGTPPATPAATPEVPAGTPPPGNDDNNTGNDTAIDADFWSPVGDNATPAPTPAATPTVQSTDTPPGNSGLEGFQAKMKGLNFGEVLTPEIQAQITEGDFSGLQGSITTMMQQAVTQAVMMTAQMVRSSEDTLMGKVSTQIQGSLNVSDTRKALQAAIPMAAKPEMSPILEGIMAQAMKHNKGDTAKSIQTTKRFVEGMSHLAAADGIVNAPPGAPGSGGMESNAGEPANWLEEVYGILGTPDQNQP